MLVAYSILDDKLRCNKLLVMQRRILPKIAENDLSIFGDTPTLADPGVIDGLVENRADS